jgi:predicted DNA-binding transcriptional regulator AlpA
MSIDPYITGHGDGADPDDDVLDARSAAAFIGVSLPTLWRQVDAGELPAPFYPAPRAPRWRKRELRAACESKRMRPAEAQAQRRARAERRQAGGDEAPPA